MTLVILLYISSDNNASSTFYAHNTYKANNDVWPDDSLIISNILLSSILSNFFNVYSNIMLNDIYI